MSNINFDLASYIAKRKGAEQASSEKGMAYAYSGDKNLLKKFSDITPVSLASEAMVRLWNMVARDELLGTAINVTPIHYPKVFTIANECADCLQMVPPKIFILPEHDVISAHSFGTPRDEYLLLNDRLINNLTEEELRFVIGHECGHIQNNHILYLTSLYYLQHSANFFLRWIVSPAVVALRSWSRRAEITADRAGLICSQNLRVSQIALIKLMLGEVEPNFSSDIYDYLQKRGEGEGQREEVIEPLIHHPKILQRIDAMELFGKTYYYLRCLNHLLPSKEGKSLIWCDKEVREVMMSVNIRVKSVKESSC